jgi:hypothetical protein
MSLLVKCWVGHFTTPYFGTDRKPKSPLCYAANRSKIVNADGFGDYFNGLKPTYQLKENLGNLDVLEVTEPL